MRLRTKTFRHASKENALFATTGSWSGSWITMDRRGYVHYECAEKAWRDAVEALDKPKPQRQVAKEIGKDQSHVSRMAKVWKLYGDDHGHHDRSFDSYYQEVKTPRYNH